MKPPAVDLEPTHWLAGFLQLNDTFYPTGAYAHSYGLEALIHEGVVRDRRTLDGFLRASALPSLRQLDLPLARHAWDALALPDWPRVARLCELSSALRNTSEARAASEAIGRQRADLCARLHASPLASAFSDRAALESWPVATPMAVALEARVLGAPVEAALTSLYYGTISGLIAAAMKLLRIGQNGAHSLLAELLSRAPDVIAESARIQEDEIGWFNPWLDIASARHESAPERLFIS